MTREELWALIEYHAGEMGRPGSGPVNYWPGSNRALRVDDHAQRVSALCKEVYALEKRREQEEQEAKQACAPGASAAIPPSIQRIR